MAKLDIDFKLIRLGSDNTKGIPGEPPLDPPEPVDYEAERSRRDQKQQDEWEKTRDRELWSWILSKRLEMITEKWKK